MFNVYEQQDGRKHLKEQYDIDVEDEVQFITAARNPREKNMAVCVTCNHSFEMKNGLKNMSKKSILSSGVTILAKCREIERK